VDLSAAARNMSGGNLDVPLPEVKSRDEVLQLRDSFAYMQRSLTDYINELKTTTAANNRMEGELSVARDIQMGMLQSDFPPTLHAKLVPAKEVGGDLYDFMTLDDGTLYFAIGDVSGKGAPAALMMSITRAALRFVAGLGLDMAQAMSRVNDSIAEANSGDMFVTLFIGRLNPATGVMEYCNGGHNPIIVMGPDRHVRFLKAKPNLALGVMEGFRYEAERMQLEHGTRLLLYTDGVTEAERADKEQYGEGRLLAWAGNHSGETTEEAFVEGLYESVKEYTGDNPQNDDITIMSIKY
jgi:sigma-B regulation protein RsbU (phosphoserine phosphatase)